MIGEMAAPRPFAPPLLRLRQPRPGIDVAFADAMRGMPAERERQAGALADAELGDGAELLALQLDAGMQLHRVGAGDGAQPEIGAPHPGDRMAVAEAQHELHAHADAAAVAAHDAEDIDMLLVKGSGMKSISVTAPSSVSKLVSRMVVSPR